jgi:hypothetical protein
MSPYIGFRKSKIWHSASMLREDFGFRFLVEKASLRIAFIRREQFQIQGRNTLSNIPIFSIAQNTPCFYIMFM